MIHEVTVANFEPSKLQTFGPSVKIYLSTTSPPDTTYLHSTLLGHDPCRGSPITTDSYFIHNLPSYCQTPSFNCLWPLKQYNLAVENDAQNPDRVSRSSTPQKSGERHKNMT